MFIKNSTPSQGEASWRVLVDAPQPRAGRTWQSGNAATETAPDKATVLMLSDQARAIASTAPEAVGTVELKPALSPEEFAATREKMKGQLILSRLGRTNPEGAAALREALANDTVKTQRAADVPGVNYKSKETFTYDANGYVKSQKVEVDYFRPSADIQAIIDAGRGAPMWQSGVGDVWITW